MKKTAARNLSVALSAAIVTFIVYLPALRNQFVDWDDRAYIYENYFIRSLDAKLFKIAFLDYPVSYWHPLTWISHAIDYSLWGLNPVGHHLTNLVLHGVNTFLVVFFMLALLSAIKETGRLPHFLDDRGRLIAAGTVGLLFGIHPLHVESVAWVSERKDLLCTLFFLLAMIAYSRYAAAARTEGRPEKGFPQFFNGHYLSALGMFALALASKPMAVSLPAVLLVLDWYPFERIRSFRALRRAVAEKLPFIAFSLSISLLTLRAQKAVGSMDITEATTLSVRILVACKSLVLYLGKIVFPLNLVPLYPYPRDVSFSSAAYLLPLAFAAGITTVCMAVARKQKLWLAAWGYFLIMLLPVLGLIQVGGQAMADRYMYLPSLAPFLVAGLAAAWIWFKAGTREAPGIKTTKLAFAVVAASLLIFLSFLTVKQIAVWRNSMSLWNWVIEKEPDQVPMAYYNRAISFTGLGRIDEALGDFDKAIALDPAYFEAYNNRGILYGQLGLIDKALDSFNESVAINPNIFQTYINRGLTYSLAGRYDKALEDFNSAIGLDQNYGISYFNRGKLFLATGNKESAASDFRKACELRVDDACAALQEQL